MPATNFEDVQKELNIIRGFKRNNLIKEFVSPESDSINQNVVDNENRVDPNVLKNEQDKFIKAVTPRVQFRGFNVYPKDNNAVFSGVIQGFNNLEFKYTLEEKDGCYISCKDLELSDELFDILKKLYGYYDVWADDWGEKLNNFTEQ